MATTYTVGDKTKSNIINESRKLFYKKGYTETTYTDISKAADVNRALIPYHFKNKELLEKSEDVIELKHNIANLRAKGKLEEAKNLEKLYNNHPLVNNYEASKEALYQLLKTIENIIK